MTLNDFLKEAREKKQAIGHFNFATEDVLKAIVSAAKESGAPCVMVGTSEGEADFVGMKEAVALARAVADDFQYPVFLNADHFKSFEKSKEAIDAGYDSIIIDTSRLSLEENRAAAKQVVEYARSINPNISIEGELGYLKGSSEVQQKIEISTDDYSKPEEVADFIAQTGVDRMAVVFGNIHGIVKEVVSAPTTESVGVPTEASGEEKLDIDHFSKIVAAAPNAYYVLHGASGLKDEDVRAAIQAGITNVHFNTELRVAYHDTLEKTMHDNPTETTPYKYLGPAAEEVKNLVLQKLALFK